MRIRLRLFVCSVVLGIVLVSSAQVKTACQTSTLPSGAQVLLDRKYADGRLKDVSDLGADDQRLWVTAHPKDCPGIAIGHFETADQLSYAILLVPKSESSHGYKIVVLAKVAADDRYVDRVLDQNAQASDSGMVISTAPRGSYSDFEGTTSVHLKVDAVNVEWIEKGAVVYYWEHGKYRTIQTSD